MYKLESVSLDLAKVPDPNKEGAVMYRLAPPNCPAPAGQVPQTFEEFECAVKNDAQSFILSTGNGDHSSSVSNGICVSSKMSQSSLPTMGELIEKLGTFSSTSLPSDHLNVLHQWESLLKKIQKLDQLVSKAESTKKVR